MGGKGLRLFLSDRSHTTLVGSLRTALLQEATWWVALLCACYGELPEDFQEFAVLLENRFGSSTKIDRARATLRYIRQG